MATLQQALQQSFNDENCLHAKAVSASSRNVHVDRQTHTGRRRNKNFRSREDTRFHAYVYESAATVVGNKKLPP